MEGQLVKVLSVLHGLLGVSAIISGLLFILDPSGSYMFLSTDILEGSPFHNYLIPGLALFSLIGLGNCLALYCNKRKRRLAPYSAIVLGGSLMLWIAAQVLMIGLIFFLQPLFFFIGLLMVLAGAILYQNQKV